MSDKSTAGHRHARRENFLYAMHDAAILRKVLNEVEQQVDDARILLELSDEEWLADFDARRDADRRLSDDEVRRCVDRIRALKAVQP
ncbi:hypothetical protein [Roseicella sp. DB1501]|uniref:hypothetical protein n=1 Tax=Roseicella sp. DB1501 TaxID=2730925 RepID=UPI0014921F9B|nr:hypothetical protein [Roseicella sp. DB1501]NOG69786.1 hypothetical protein [Roseicella sp. DB1501]